MNFFFLLIKEAFIFGIVCAIVAAIISPLQFAKIIRQQTGEKYSEIFKRNYNTGGIKVFYRGAYPYGKLQFLSSASFGFSEFLCIFLLKKINLESVILAIIIRALSASVFETAMTIKSEVQEISRNKGELMKVKGTIASSINAIFFRNALFWMASLISGYLIEQLGISYISGILLSAVLGMLFAVITIPLDLVATQNCGDDESHSIISRMKKIIQDNNQYSSIYRGSLMRIIQIGIFTVVTTFTGILLKSFS